MTRTSTNTCIELAAIAKQVCGLEASVSRLRNQLHDGGPTTNAADTVQRLGYMLGDIEKLEGTVARAIEWLNRQAGFGRVREARMPQTPH